MKKLPVMLTGVLALTLSVFAQNVTPSAQSNAKLKTVAWQEDRDDRKPQGDQDDQNLRDRDKDKKDKDKRDRDRARRGDRDDDNRQYNRGDNDRDRANGQNGQYDRDRDNGQYSDHDRNGQYRGDNDRDRQGGYYGNNGYGRYGQYHNVLAPEWQQKFDSYYQRWLQYRATNNRGEMASMESRMRDIMAHYNIPTDVPYDRVASPGVGGYQNRY